MTGEETRQYKKGLWTEDEDKILIDYVNVHGKGHWDHVSKKTGLKRGGKSCRLRWMNYLCPNVKRGSFTEEEEDLIIRLHKLIGNRWSLIAKRVPGRTDNQVKNYWNTHLRKKLALQGKTTRIGVSSSRISMGVKDSETDMNSGLSHQFGKSLAASDHIVVENGTQEATEALETEEQVINSFLIVNDYVELSTLGLELGWYSFDLA